ncbi:MAG TPA: metallophosphoesterase [Thermoleophilaceae bacterium]|nr:metallophosphoesterase [Thermoleophilaceae bacterium]
MGFEGNGAFAVSAAVDALVVCGLVVWAVRTRAGWLRLACGCGLVLVFLALKGVVLVASGLGIPFGVMHVLWLDLVVVLPLAALLLGALTWRTGGAALRALAVLGLLLAPVGAYASFVEPERLVVERVNVDLAPQRAGDADVRIAVIADLQFERLGDHEREAVARAMAERPDLILLSGDYHQGMSDSFEQELPDLRRLLSKLRAPGGVFAVQGDAESVAKARRVFAGAGIRLLVDEQASTQVRDRTISIAGLRLRYWQASARGLAERFEARPGTADVRLLLAHRPDAAQWLAPDTRVDLVVAGHTHGGQLQLPLFGPLTTASDVPREVAAGGLHSLGGRRIYVSRGIGVERGQAPRLRLGAPPEVSIVTLR